MFKFLQSVIALVFTLASQSLLAQVTLVSWDFHGFSGSGSASSATYASMIDPGLTIGDFNLVGVNPIDQTNIFAAEDWSATENTGLYFSFSVTVDAGKSVNIGSFDYYLTRMKKGNNKGPEQFNVYTSVDNYSAPVGTYSFANNGASTASGTVDLSGVGNMQNVTGMLEFRFVGFEDTSWFGFGPIPAELILCYTER
jgi:hypothetical protein